MASPANAMRFVFASFPIALLAASLSCSIAPHPEGGFAPPPPALRGDWALAPEPSSIISDRPHPVIRLRITATNFFYRFSADSDTLAGVDGDTGDLGTFVTDKDGARWQEEPHYRIVVDTSTTPWQIDLSKRSKAGVVIERKGICVLHNDTLKFDIGRAGKSRPTTLDDSVEATRVKGGP